MSRDQIKNIKTDAFPNKYKFYLMKILTSKNLVTFFEATSLEKFVTFTKIEELEEELNKVFADEEFSCPIILKLYQEIFLNSSCMRYIFNNCPKLFSILWEVFILLILIVLFILVVLLTLFFLTILILFYLF